MSIMSHQMQEPYIFQVMSVRYFIGESAFQNLLVLVLYMVRSVVILQLLKNWMEEVYQQYYENMVKLSY